MSDLISRQDAIKTVCRTRCGDKAKGCPAHSCPVIEEFDALPSAETSQNLAKPIKALKGSDLISRDVVLANIDERLRANWYGNVGLVSEFNRLIGYVRNIPSAESTQREKALLLLLDWAVECGFGYDNIPEEYATYEKNIENMGYMEGLIYIAEREVEQNE